MIILDVTTFRSACHVPMAWLKGTDPAIRATMQQAFQNIQRAAAEKQRRTKVRFNGEIIVLGPAQKSKPEDDESLGSNSSSSSSSSSSCDGDGGRRGRCRWTPEERQKIWYSKREIQAMRTDSKEEIREKNITKDSEDFSVRGLEDAVSLRASHAKKARRRLVIHNVLGEQRRQRKHRQRIQQEQRYQTYQQLQQPEQNQQERPQQLNHRNEQEQPDQQSDPDQNAQGQKKQNSDCDDDLEKIRKKSRLASKASVQLALSLAAKDALEANGQPPQGEQQEFFRRNLPKPKATNAAVYLDTGTGNAAAIEGWSRSDAATTTNGTPSTTPKRSSSMRTTRTTKINKDPASSTTPKRSYSMKTTRPSQIHKEGSSFSAPKRSISLKATSTVATSKDTLSYTTPSRSRSSSSRASGPKSSVSRNRDSSLTVSPATHSFHLRKAPSPPPEIPTPLPTLPNVGNTFNTSLFIRCTPRRTSSLSTALEGKEDEEDESYMAGGSDISEEPQRHQNDRIRKGSGVSRNTGLSRSTNTMVKCDMNGGEHQKVQTKIFAINPVIEDLVPHKNCSDDNIDISPVGLADDDEDEDDDEDDVIIGDIRSEMRKQRNTRNIAKKRTISSNPPPKLESCFTRNKKKNEASIPTTADENKNAGKTGHKSSSTKTTEGGERETSTNKNSKKAKSDEKHSRSHKKSSSKSASEMTKTDSTSTGKNKKADLVTATSDCGWSTCNGNNEHGLEVLPHL